MKRVGLIAVVVASVSCGPPANLLPVNDLNRPTDVVFMCFGAFGAGGADGGVDAGAGAELHVSGRPMQACHPTGEYDPGATTTTRTFAFMPNSAAGTLSAVDADHWKLVDLNLQTGGYGTAPLGQDPEQISASDDGCRLISANRASCDLTLVDPSVLVAQTLSSENGNNVDVPSPRAYGQTFRPIKKDGTTLIAPPYEAVFLPQNTNGLLASPPTLNLPLLPGQNALCGDTPTADTVGWPGAKSWHVLVTYPTCDLIALVELPSGQILDSAKVVQTTGPVGPGTDPNGKTITLVDTGPSPVCPVSACAGQVLPAGTGATPAVDAAGNDGAPTHAVPGDGAVADAASDAAGGGVGTGAGATTGSGGAAGTGTGVAGASGGGTATADAGAGGTQGSGAFAGNQYPNVAYFGAGPLSPSGIAVLPDGSRAYIGLANASFVLSVRLSSAGLGVPGNGIYLNEGARGVSRIRLNVNPTQVQNLDPTTTVVGSWVGVDPNDTATLDRQYLYAIARDGTLRVISVFKGGAETECETNVDPVHLPAGVSASTSCVLPVSAKNRRPFSVGPGIHFPSLPVDVAAADIAKSPPDYSEQSVNGAHAWVITDSGLVYLVNISPVLRQFTAVVDNPLGSGTNFASIPNAVEATPFINTLRDSNQISYSLTLSTTAGPPRVDILPTQPAVGPYVEPFWTQGSSLNATAVTSAYLQTVAFFPKEPFNADNAYDPIDRRAVTPQTWSVAWEGALSGIRPTGNIIPDGVLSPPFPAPAPPTIAGLDGVFQDNGANFCQMGVVAGDLLTMTGCTDNSQCGIGEQCIFGDGVSSAAAGLSVNGICVDPNQVSSQQNNCAEFLNSVRRYQILGSSQHNMILRPNLDEIVISPLLPPCHPARGADAGVAPDGGADGGGPEMDSCPDTADDPTTADFKCVSNADVTGGALRCLMPCASGSDADCRAGRVCVDFKPVLDNMGRLAAPKCSTGECFCADGPPISGGFGVGNGSGSPAKTCFDQLVNYQVNVGKSFLVSGSQSGVVYTGPLPPNDGQEHQCIYQGPSDGRFTFRIPMNAQQVCTDVDSSVVAGIDSRLNPDFVTGADQAAAQAGAQKLVDVVTSSPQPADPCFYIGGPVVSDPITTSTPDAGTMPTHTHVRALFQNAQLSFVLANMDRSPTTQLVLTFDVHGGFGPQVVQDPPTVEVSMPARIIVGPVDSLSQITTGIAPIQYEAPYLFVVDQRRLGREQGGGPTRGQLLRINPYGYTSTVGNATGYQPLFEDYNTSGGLFPIQ